MNALIQRPSGRSGVVVDGPADDPHRWGAYAYVSIPKESSPENFRSPIFLLWSTVLDGISPRMPNGCCRNR